MNINLTKGMKSSEFILIIIYMVAVIFQMKLDLSADALTQLQWVLITYIGGRSVVKGAGAIKGEK